MQFTVFESIQYKLFLIPVVEVSPSFEPCINRIVLSSANKPFEFDENWFSPLYDHHTFPIVFSSTVATGAPVLYTNNVELGLIPPFVQTKYVPTSLLGAPKIVKSRFSPLNNTRYVTPI